MALLGSLVALGAALVFAVVALLLGWGGAVTVQRELRASFRHSPPRGSEGWLTLLFTVGPLFGAALLSLFAAAKISLVALGISGF